MLGGKAGYGRVSEEVGTLNLMLGSWCCGISLVDGTARSLIGGDLDQWEWPAKLCIVVHGGSCCLQYTSAKKSLSAFSRSRRHQMSNLFYYSTTYRTQFQYISMFPPVKFPFKGITWSEALLHIYSNWQSMLCLLDSMKFIWAVDTQLLITAEKRTFL